MELALTIICLALAALLAYEKWQNARDRRERDSEWRLERTGLLTRIQHPQILDPRTLAEGPETEMLSDEELLTRDADEVDLVGTVQMNGAGDAD